MEQLTSDAVRQVLVQGLGAVQPPEPGAEPALWAKRRRPLLCTQPANLSAGGAAEAADDAQPSSVERRLPRRAERLWEKLRGDRALPPETAVRRLLAQPFAGHALLVRQDPGSEPRITYAGAELESLGARAADPAPADVSPTAPIGQRLVALGLRAAAIATPCHLDSDDDPDLPIDHLQTPKPPLLFRAVALPLAAEMHGALTAVVVVSWRRLLSAAETEALHRELAAAIDWLSAGGPGTTKRPERQR